jgi:hypothetical protein
LQQEHEQRHRGIDKHLAAAEAAHEARHNAQSFADHTTSERRELRADLGDDAQRKFLAGMTNVVRILKSDASPAARDHVTRLLLNAPIAPQLARSKPGEATSDDDDLGLDETLLDGNTDDPMRRAYKTALRQLRDREHDQADTRAMIENSAVLDTLFAGMPRQKAFRQTFALWQEMKRDPHNVVHRLHAQLNPQVPATETEVQQERSLQLHVAEVVQQLDQHVPHWRGIQTEMGKYLASRAFPSTGDNVTDAFNAYTHISNYKNAGGNFEQALAAAEQRFDEVKQAEQEFGEIISATDRRGEAKMPLAQQHPVVRAAMVHLVADGDFDDWQAATTALPRTCNAIRPRSGRSLPRWRRRAAMRRFTRAAGCKSRATPYAV